MKQNKEEKKKGKREKKQQGSANYYRIFDFEFFKYELFFSSYINECTQTSYSYSTIQALIN